MWVRLLAVFFMSFLLGNSFAQKLFLSANYDSITKTPIGPYPDYSLAGSKKNMSGFIDQPSLWKTYDVKDFGAIPDDNKDDIEAIQLAINTAAKNGGGIIKFPQGRFDFDVNTVEKFLTITASNILLIGYGAGADGTEFYDHKGSDWPNKKEKWMSGTLPSFIAVGKKETDFDWDKPFATITGIYNQHQYKLKVDKTNDLKEGQVILLAIRPKIQSDSSVLLYCTYPSKTIGKNLANLGKDNTYKIQQRYRIRKVWADSIMLEQPLIVPIKENWVANIYVCKNNIENVGIVGFRFTTTWSEEFRHHLNPVHDNGFDGIKFNNATDCFVLGMEFRNTSTAIGLFNALNCTIEDCRITGNRGHNGFQFGGTSTRCLGTRLQGGTQLHTFCLQNYASANVFLQCLAGEPAGIDCHGGLGVYNLVDNLKGGIFASGGNVGNTPPGIGTGLVFWNWTMGAVHPYNFRMADYSLSSVTTPGLVAIGLSNQYNWPIRIATSQKNKKTGPALVDHDQQTKALWVESLGQNAKPWSLYHWLKEKNNK